jgi:hypothetical protein
MLRIAPTTRIVAAVIAGALFTASPTLAQGQPGRGEGQREGGRQPGGQRGGGGGGMFGGMGMGGMGQVFEPPINSRELDTYAQMLGLDADQTEALTALLEAHQQEFNESARIAREKLESLREEAREARDPQVWREMGAQMETFRKARQKMEDSFFSDFKAVLTPAQTEKFPKIERQRRREQTIGRGLMSGERVDLIRTIADLKLPAEQLEAVQPTLDLYEADLDRELATRNTVYEESQSKIREMFEAGNMDEMQKVLEKGREASKRVRDVNRRYARQLETMLPTEAQAKFAEQVRRESFPMVYRPTQASRALEAARAFTDLDENQTAALGTLAETYDRELTSLNKQLEQATLDREESITAQDLMSRGMGGFRGEDGPAGELREKRRELDNTTMDKLRALLTPEQIENLPRRDDRAGPGGGDREGGRDGGGRQQPRRRPGGGGDDAAPPPNSRT